MKRKAVSGLLLILLFFGVLSFVFYFQPVKASGTIYIRADGNIDPPTANITTVDNVTYTFTDNNYDEVVIEKDNVIIDGVGYNLQVQYGLAGVYLTGRSNITIRNMEIEGFDYGIYLYSSSNNTISGNNIATIYEAGIWVRESSNNSIHGNNIACKYDMWGGIWVLYGSSNSVYGNNVTGNGGYGILLADSSNNSVSENNITANLYDGIGIVRSSNNGVCGNYIAANYEAGIRLYESSKNVIFQNNFINNLQQTDIHNSTDTRWDNGYPSGGNYWSDYYGTDVNQDGIGDIAYVIAANNTDNYPLMGMFYDFKATSDHNVQTTCNSTISSFQFSGTSISFNVSGEDGTTGFCRICIPKALMNITYKVYVNGTEVPYNLLPFSNSTHNCLYFIYQHSTQKVTIAQGMLIPPVGGIYIPTNKLSLLAPYVGLTILLAVAAATIVYVKKRKKA